MVGHRIAGLSLLTPMASVALGLVIVVLVARFGGYDALPDPIGWLVVLWGVRRLPDPALLLTLAGAALVVACAVWLPTTQDVLDRGYTSLRWAINLPQVIFCVALCHQLSALARRSGDTRAAAWQRTTMMFNAVLAPAPAAHLTASGQHHIDGERHRGRQGARARSGSPARAAPYSQTPK